jgi:hypothetical protein
VAAPGNCWLDPLGLNPERCRFGDNQWNVSPRYVAFLQEGEMRGPFQGIPTSRGAGLLIR